MTLDKAKEILGKRIRDNGNLYSLHDYLSFVKGDDEITFDGEFSLKLLEAIVVYCKSIKD